MRLKLLAITLAALWGLLPALAAGAEDDGNADVGDFALLNVQDLVDLCTVPQGHDLSDQGAYFCMGYMTAMMQYHNAVTSGPKIKPIICPGPNVTRLELVEAFVDWARAHPEDKDQPAIDGVAESAVGKWPCG